MQTWVVSYVVLHPEQAIYAKTLEQVLHLKHPTICGILQRLEAKGFITFAVDEADRRCHRIIPTELALQAHRQAAEGLDAVERQLLAGFSPEEAAQFHDYLAPRRRPISARAAARQVRNNRRRHHAETTAAMPAGVQARDDPDPDFHGWGGHVRVYYPAADGEAYQWHPSRIARCEFITNYGLALLAMALLSLGFGALSGVFCATASAGYARNLRHDLFYHVQDFSFANIDRFSTSSLVTRLTTDVTNVQMAFMMIMPTAVRAPLLLVAVSMSISVGKPLARGSLR